MSADNTQNLLGSVSGILSTMVLGSGGPAPSVSVVTFLVNLTSRATLCHGVPHRLSQYVAFHASLSVCLLLFDHDDQKRFLGSYDLQVC